jgi:hypothetical protein
VLRGVPLLTGLVLVIAVAVVQGMWTQRWQKSADLDSAVGRLANAPGDLGTWKSESAAFDAEALTEAGALGSWVRRYTDACTGASVLVILMCGPSGKMSVHHPEHCYRGAGYEIMAEPVRCQVTGPPAATCWTTRFRKQETTGDVHLRVFWTWLGNGVWQAPDRPRLRFAPLPALYKLYVVHELPPGQEKLEQDPSLRLLQQLLPALTEALKRP